MAQERRIRISDPAVLEALAHPIRLDLLGFLMDAGPATASACARAVGDSPSNCSYHLRVLAKHGLVEHAASADGREKPWRALVTGVSPEVDADDAAASAGEAALAEASIRLDQRLAEEHLRTRHLLPEPWRDVSAHASYGLRVTPQELHELVEGIDALVRPYIAATRAEEPEGSAIAHLALLAFPRARFETS